MGDLNATPESKPITFLQDKWQILTNPKQFTCPSVTPRMTINYVMGFQNQRADLCEIQMCRQEAGWSTVMVLEKKGDKLTVEVINTA